MGDMKSVLAQLLGKEYIHSSDLKNAFNALPLDEPSQDSTTFVVPHGEFAFRVLCAGLPLTPSVYTQIGSEILGQMRLKEWTNWLDDFTGGCLNFDYGLEILEKLFVRFRLFGVKINVAKTR